MSIKHKTNPFVDRIIIEQGRSIRKIGIAPLTASLKDKRGKEILNTSMDQDSEVIYALEHKVDSEPFTKLFKKNAWIFKKFSGNGLRLFFFICTQIEFNRDLFHLDMENAMKFLGVKNPPPVYNGVNNLIKGEVISKHTEPNFYWVNPTIFYTGERRFLIYNKEVQERIAKQNGIEPKKTFKP